MRSLNRALPGLLALLLPFSAQAAAPTLIPVTGFLTDDSGTPIDGTVDLDFDLYTSPTDNVSRFHELQNDVVVENGRFTVYLGAESSLNLGLFRDYGTVYLAMSVNAAADLSPRFEIGSAPYAGYAQYCEDAGSVDGIDSADLAQVGDDVEWFQIVNAPAGLDDGDQDTKYTAGNGLTLTGTQFLLTQSVVEGYARGVAYDSQAELTAALAGKYVPAPNVSCVADQVLVADGAGAWDCGDISDLPLDEVAVDLLVSNNGYAMASGLTALAGRVSTAEGNITTLQGNITTINGTLGTLRTDITGLQATIAGVQNNSGNIVAQYELDESSGISFADTSGFNNPAVTTNGGLLVGASGHAGQSITFGGSKGIAVASANNMPSPAQVWVEAWVTPVTNTLNASRVVVEKNGSYRLRQVNDKLEFTVYTEAGGAAGCVVTHTTPITAASWHYVAGWYDGINATVSLDGVIQSVQCKVSTTLGQGRVKASPGSILSIGAHYDGAAWTEGYRGEIDEVRVRPTAPNASGQYGQGTFEGSTLLTATQQARLNDWANLPNQKWVLCYKKSIDGANGTTFRNKCKFRGDTFTVVQNSNTLQIFGGYSRLSWTDNTSYYGYTGASFLFSVTNDKKYPVGTYDVSTEIYNVSNYGPTFGNGHDLHINAAMTGGYCNFPYGYVRDGETRGAIVAAQAEFCGGNSSTLAVGEIEVFIRKP